MRNMPLTHEEETTLRSMPPFHTQEERTTLRSMPPSHQGREGHSAQHASLYPEVHGSTPIAHPEVHGSTPVTHPEVHHGREAYTRRYTTVGMHIPGYTTVKRLPRTSYSLLFNVKRLPRASLSLFPGYQAPESLF